MPEHRNITIYGQVQGVGFRRAARDQARYMGIKGFVKNNPDGTVYIEAEAEEPAINLFIQWCRQGPPFARVEKLEVLSAIWQNLSGFETKY